MTFAQESILNNQHLFKMEEILLRLEKIEQLIGSQNLIGKEVLNFNEAAIYLELSHSHLYKLTSSGTIPFYKPNGKKLYFKRLELDNWILRHRQSTKEELQQHADKFQLKNGRAK